MKPLGKKTYGSIPHLPGSRTGPADHTCHEGQARIATCKTRDKHDEVFITEKLDGGCVGIARIDGELFALGRSGHLAITSPYTQHRLFARWVLDNHRRFMEVLDDGQRLVGEWLLMAHGTRYELHHEPFVAFDLMEGDKRFAYDRFCNRVKHGNFITPHLIHRGGPLGIDEVLTRLGKFGFHGAIDPVEGAVWRVERRGVVDFLAKYVIPDKIDGCYLDDDDPVWNGWSE